MTKRSKLPNLKPLRRFDYKLVQSPLDGLLINVDRDLQRRAKQAEKVRDWDSARELALLNIMVRFTKNAYHAVLFVAAETPECPARKKSYSLIIAPVNRQLLDLLFTLVYMLDDFGPRSLQYQRAGWRETVEELQKFKNEYSNAPEWKGYFLAGRRAIDFYADFYGISGDERKNPSLIKYWKHPGGLSEQKTTSRSFLRWLEKWLYQDTSAQAHLSFGGLLTVAPIIISELFEGEDREIVEGRMMSQYHFHQLSRTSLVALAIATEINKHCNLQNDEKVSYLWRIFSEHALEAKEMFEARYEVLLKP